MKDSWIFEMPGRTERGLIFVALLSLVTLCQGSYFSRFPKGRRIYYLIENVGSGLIEQRSDDLANAIFNAFAGILSKPLDVNKIQTKKLSLLLRFYFHVVLQHLKTFIQTNFPFKRPGFFVLRHGTLEIPDFLA